MIFVTVGTHEQPFDRLIEAVEHLKRAGLIAEDVMMQTGYSTYEPRYCRWSRLLSYREMEHYITEARIVITHGGPASFIQVLQAGKVPIVVPRQKKYGEHVNDHQVEFVRETASRTGMIIPVINMHDLGNTIQNYDEAVSLIKPEMVSNNKAFNQKLEELVKNLFYA